MKKLFFSLAAIMVMVCSALSFASCSSDDDETGEVSCTFDFSVQLNGEISQSDTSIVASAVGVLNAYAMEAAGAQKVNLTATSVNGKLAPDNTAISKLQTTIMQNSEVQGTITDLKNKKDSKGNALVSHLNFNVYDASDNTTCYYTNSIF